MNERGFKSGDIVRITAIGPYSGRKAKVLDKKVIEGAKSYTVWFNYDTPEPYMKVFAEEHLELIVEPEKEEKVGEIKDSGERTEKPQENNGVNIWIKNAFGMGTIIIEAINGDVHLFMEHQKQDCTIVGQI